MGQAGLSLGESEWPQGFLCCSGGPEWLWCQGSLLLSAGDMDKAYNVLFMAVLRWVRRRGRALLAECGPQAQPQGPWLSAHRQDLDAGQPRASRPGK